MRAISSTCRACSRFSQPCPLLLNRNHIRRNATIAAASNLAPELQQSINREASLPTPDAARDSQTVRLVDSQTPFMVPTYVRPNLMLQQGEGCYVYDVENRQYLDFTAGIAVNALGHCDPGMTKVIAQQAQTLIHVSNLYHNPWIGSLSKLLVEVTRNSGAMSDASKAFICNSGSEANEAAIKFARKYGRTVDPSGRKNQIVSFNGSFHGRTMGALSATPNPKYQKPFGPMVPGFRYGDFNDIGAIDRLVTPETCGVLIEPIQGEGGINVATKEFLIALRRRCTEVDAVLIYDEIQCGLARTGSLWAHSFAGKEAHPDILTTAKALGNGFPIGAAIVTEDVSSKVVTGDHGTTFGGNPLASRVAHYVVTRLAEAEMLKSVEQKGEVFRRYFERLQRRFPHLIREVRGRGLMLGLQLTEDPTLAITAARERGLLIISCGTNTLRFVPPLIITEEEIEKGVGILEDALAAAYVQRESLEGTDGQQEMRAS